jgi:hypothetical protein
LDAEARARFGDGLIAAIAGHAATIGDDWAEPGNFKFLSEAIIACGVAGTPAALALAARLAAPLHAARLPAAVAQNPRSIAMLALPLLFLPAGTANAAAVRGLFARLHSAGATIAPHHPAYRNLEMQFIAAALAGRRFRHDPFPDLLPTLPWAGRDQLYGVAHIHLYNSDFGRRQVRYPAPATAAWCALIARADAADDLDLLAELLLCAASTAGLQRQRAWHDALAIDVLARMGCAAGVEGCDFARLYHPLFLLWMLLAVRGEGFAPRTRLRQAAAHHALGALLTGAGAAGVIDFVAGYADYCGRFGAHPAIEPALGVAGALLAVAADQDL